MQNFKIKTFFSQEMVADIGGHISPSAGKPAILAEVLKKSSLPLEFCAPKALLPEEIALAHSPNFVKNILSGKRSNGFGNTSEAVIRSLPFTSGALFNAAEHVATGGQVAAALVSGFHHAGYEHSGGFCTFNGLMITAKLLMEQYGVQRLAIIDADYHYGDGTQEIIDRLGLAKNIFHYSFGKDFHSPKDANAYLTKMKTLRKELEEFCPSLILYQAGADAHRDDPLGGVLSTDELYQRDKLMFEIARDLEIGIAWNLAGGYQRDADGGISKVIEVHMNTFRAAAEVFQSSNAPAENLDIIAQRERDKIVERAEDLLRDGEIKELNSFCGRMIETCADDPRIWQLWGVALGSLEDPERARKCFHTALKLCPRDGYSLANYITACFHEGDANAAAATIEEFYPGLEIEQQQIVLISVVEALKEGLLSKETLPSCVLELLNL